MKTVEGSGGPSSCVYSLGQMANDYDLLLLKATERDRYNVPL